MDNRTAADRLEELYPTPSDCAKIGAALAKMPKEERDGLLEMLKGEQLKLALDNLLLAPAPGAPSLGLCCIRSNVLACIDTHACVCLVWPHSAPFRPFRLRLHAPTACAKGAR